MGRGTHWTPCVRLAASYTLGGEQLIVCNFPMVVEDLGWEVICRQDIVHYEVLAYREHCSESFPGEGWIIRIPGDLLKTGEHWMWVPNAS